MPYSKADPTESEAVLFPDLPRAQILSAYAASPGDELASGKFASPASSAALVANTFGFFLNDPELLPALPGMAEAGWPAQRIELEACARFPWSGGQHPWLDVLISTRTHLIAIESKRFEPFRPGKSSQLSEAYWRPLWGPAMDGYQAVRDGLADGKLAYKHLDAHQLIKHALGVRAEAGRRGLQPILAYLYAQTLSWPDESEISDKMLARHRDEVADFAGRVSADEVSFVALTYGRLLSSLCESWEARVRDHAVRLGQHYEPGET